MNVVNYEIAKKLKDRWFREECLLHYTDTGSIFSNSIDTYDRPNQELDYSDFQKCFNNGNSIWLVDAPTISQVLKWLREEFSLHISQKPYACKDGLLWMYELRKFNKRIVFVIANKTGFVEEEQAALAGIEYVIDNLI